MNLKKKLLIFSYSITAIILAERGFQQSPSQIVYESRKLPKNYISIGDSKQDLDFLVSNALAGEVSLKKYTIEQLKKDLAPYLNLLKKSPSYTLNEKFLDTILIDFVTQASTPYDQDSLQYIASYLLHISKQKWTLDQYSQLLDNIKSVISSSKLPASKLWKNVYIYPSDPSEEIFPIRVTSPPKSSDIKSGYIIAINPIAFGLQPDYVVAIVKPATKHELRHVAYEDYLISYNLTEISMKQKFISEESIEYNKKTKRNLENDVEYFSNNYRQPSFLEKGKLKVFDVYFEECIINSTGGLGDYAKKIPTQKDEKLGMVIFTSKLVLDPFDKSNFYNYALYYSLGIFSEGRIGDIFPKIEAKADAVGLRKDFNKLVEIYLELISWSRKKIGDSLKIY